MAGPRQITISEPVANKVASNLRHDLVTPINLIVGYCDLLMSDAADSGQTSRSNSLRSIRDFGFILLGMIDQVLLTDAPGRSIADLRELAQDLEGPAMILIRECESLRAASTEDHDRSSFADDLEMVRSGGVRLVEMAHALAAGRFPTDQASTLA